jgi:transaldolase
VKFFIDTADIAEIRDFAETGLLDGVTTNPSLVAKTGRQFIDLVKEICEVVDGPVSAEVAATDFETMLAEGRYLSTLAPNVAVKVPLTPAGLKVCKILSRDGTMVNVTLCFSAAQALLAAKAGAAFVSPFVGRLDDVGQSGMDLIAEIAQIYAMYDQFDTQVLVASIRNPTHVVEAAKLGADVVTMPPAILRQLFQHPLTEKGLAQFVADWAKTGQTIPKLERDSEPRSVVL